MNVEYFTSSAFKTIENINKNIVIKNLIKTP